MGTTVTERLAGVNTGLSSKAPVRAGTTANITLSGEQTIDTVACVADDRVLVKDQTDGTENGIYDVKSGAWVRSRDFDGTRDVKSGTFVVLADGSNAGTVWRISTADPITVGTTSITFTQMAVEGASAFINTLLDDADASTARATLVLGSAAVEDIGTSGANVPLLSTANTWGGAQTLADNEVIRAKMKDYSETVNAIGSIGGGTQDINLESGNVITGTVDTSTTTFTFSNPPASGAAGSFTLILTNPGSQTINWPASVDWPGGTEPTWTVAGVDVISFLTTDGGTTWLGFASQDMK